MKSRLSSLAPLIAFFIVMGALAFSLTNDPQRMPSMLIDKSAPTFELAGLNDGNGLSSENLKGNIYLLNVFASWCPACRLEHSFFMQIAERRDIKIVGLDWKDNREKASRWLEERRNPYVRVGADESGRVGIDFGVTGVPETFVIDSSGRVRYRHAGPLTEEVWRETFEPLLTHLRGSP